MTTIRNTVCKVACVFLLTTATQHMAAQDGEPSTKIWSGAIQLQSLEIKIEVALSTDEAGAESGTISIPQQAAHDLELQNVRTSAESVHFELAAPNGLATFDGTFNNPNRIEGAFKQGPAAGTFFLEPGSLPIAPVDSPLGTSVQIDAPPGKLAGSLLLPEVDLPVPVVLIIGGSGPIDRDGNTAVPPMKNNCLRMVAAGLAEVGIASLRYDKRGVAGSASAGLPNPELRFEHFVNDAKLWIGRLSQDEQFSTVWLVGHSQGALVASLASKSATVDGVVSIAGTSEDAGSLLERQLSAGMPANGTQGVRALLEAIRAGEPIDERTPEYLRQGFPASLHPFLKSWFAYDPTVEVGTTQSPVLVVQGTTDVQIRVEDGRALADSSELAELAILDSMNHVLKEVGSDPGAQVKSYGDPTLPLHPELIAKISEFILRER